MSAKQNNVKLNLYYTPTVLTTNSLVFESNKMTKWWDSGFEYAQKRDQDLIIVSLDQILSLLYLLNLFI